MSGFDAVGMPELYQNAPVSKGLRNTNDGSSAGDAVDNSEGQRNCHDAAQGLSTNQGAYLEMQSKPSDLY